ncbi:hypothetical protein EJB05_24095, partial [Eragrostis curvula]
MDNGGDEVAWRFGAKNPAMASASVKGVRALQGQVNACVDKSDPRPLVPLGTGDPSPFACFRTAAAAEEAVIAAITAAKHNGYPASAGVPEACSAVAAYLSRYLPYELSPDDIVITAGCNHGIEIMMAVLASPGANVLVPRPGYPLYEARAALSGVELRHYNLLPEKGWDVDIEGVESLADENTVAMVIVNPNNPCGNVYSKEHLAKIAETARKLGIMVISDEIYDHFTFGSTPFVPMGVFGDIAPVVTLGGISKRWLVPGWRLGWLAVTDPKGFLRKKMIFESIIAYRGVSVNPAAIVQGAIPQIIANTDEAFFTNAMNIMREAAEICYQKLEGIDCITCPHKPEGSMFVMVKLETAYLEGINDDIDFCTKLAKEESVVLCPGSALEMRNWLRVTFAVDPPLLEDGLDRLKSFCLRHAKAKTNTKQATPREV